MQQDGANLIFRIKGQTKSPYTEKSSLNEQNEK